MTQDNTREALALLAELRSALCATYSLSPEGRAYLARIDAALSSQPTAPQALPLDFRPQFPDCETAEPSLSNLIHRYYGFYFEKPRSTECAEAYIAALTQSSNLPPASREPSDETVMRGLRAFNRETEFPSFADTSDIGRMRRAYAAMQRASAPSTEGEAGCLGGTRPISLPTEPQ